VNLEKTLISRVERVRELVDALQPHMTYRKMRSILNALEVQVDDGKYARHAVTRLCEALLAAAAEHSIPTDRDSQLEDAVCAVVTLVEDKR
jgi:hypothetical protein